MEKFDVIIVGAGLAGLSTAYHLADTGLEVLVVERGDYPGSKNVTGGRLYLHPVRRFFPPEFWAEAPLERHVIREKLTLMANGASTSVELSSQRFDQPPYHSHTILRSKFDRWFGDQVTARGAMVIPRQRVDDLVLEGGRVQGILADGEEIRADVVVAADGAVSLLAEKARLRQPHDPHHFAVGLKEIIELPRHTIEARFNLPGEQGLAQLYFGSLTEGIMGGGFLYTNLESLSLGLVVSVRGLMDRDPPIEAPQLMEAFRKRPEIAPLVEGGELVEYSAHTIPEGGLDTMPRLFGDGILVVGDAAGLALNMGLTVRGMDFALASGALAAQAIRRAREANDFSAATLSHYQTLLRDSFVLKDLTTFRQALEVLDNRRLFTVYPQVVCDIFEQLMWIGEGPKEKLSATAMKEAMKSFVNLSTLRDAWSLLKI